MSDTELQTINDFQQEIALWAEREWPERTSYENRHLPLYRIVALVGELADGVFDRETDHRIDPDVQAEIIRETLALVFVHCVDLASRNGWNFEETVRFVWEQTRGEDFVKHPGVGRPPKEETDA